MAFYQRRKNSGFSLIETLMAVGIFSILTVMISGIYLNATALQKNTASLQKLQNSGRYMMEKMVKEIRGREINLTATFAESVNPLNRLIFYADEYGEELELIFDAETMRHDQKVGSMVYRLNGVDDFLNSEDVEVADAKFLVFPNAENIWGQEAITDFQPRIVVYLKIKNRGVSEKYVKELVLQTTVSSKVYNR